MERGCTCRGVGDSKVIAGATVVYVAVAKHGKTVDDIYVAKARRRFGLTPDKGVSDEEFMSR